jgi:hypothetical protein
VRAKRLRTSTLRPLAGSSRSARSKQRNENHSQHYP